MQQRIFPSVVLCETKYSYDKQELDFSMMPSFAQSCSFYALRLKVALMQQRQNLNSVAKFSTELIKKRKFSPEVTPAILTFFIESLK